MLFAAISFIVFIRMWGNIRRQLDRKNRKGELYYATHHHLIPLYIISGINLVILIVLCSFVTVLWQNTQREALRPAAEQAARVAEDTYIPVQTSPAEKKQYIPSASIRFPIGDTYNLLRYSYEPGITRTPSSSTIILTTHDTVNNYSRLLMDNPQLATSITSQKKHCIPLFVIRFQAGAVPAGGFVPTGDIRLRDGRTAYIHKNANCVPGNTADMNALDDIENVVLSIESY